MTSFRGSAASHAAPNKSPYPGRGRPNSWHDLAANSIKGDDRRSAHAGILGHD